jgi:hypothetical protein
MILKYSNLPVLLRMLMLLLLCSAGQHHQPVALPGDLAADLQLQRSTQAGDAAVMLYHPLNAALEQEALDRVRMSVSSHTGMQRLATQHSGLLEGEGEVDESFPNEEEDEEEHIDDDYDEDEEGDKTGQGSRSSQPQATMCGMWSHRCLVFRGLCSWLRGRQIHHTMLLCLVQGTRMISSLQRFLQRLSSSALLPPWHLLLWSRHHQPLPACHQPQKPVCLLTLGTCLMVRCPAVKLWALAIN